MVVMIAAQALLVPLALVNYAQLRSSHSGKSTYRAEYRYLYKFHRFIVTSCLVLPALVWSVSLVLPHPKAVPAIAQATIPAGSIVENQEHHDSIQTKAMAATSGDTGTIATMGSVGVGLMLAGLFLFMIRFLRQKVHLRMLVREAQYSRYIEDKQVCVIYSDKVTIPFSHGVLSRRVFLPSELIKNRKTHDIVLRHELAHHDGKHLLHAGLESLLLHIFWLNPAMYLLRSTGSTLREILADQAAVKGHNRYELAETMFRLRPARQATP